MASKAHVQSEDPTIDGYDAELARWLAEAGRRRRSEENREVRADLGDGPRPRHPAQRFTIRRLALLMVFTISAFQYVIADTQLRIARLPTLIVFVASSGS
jgi:hypothetical protein